MEKERMPRHARTASPGGCTLRKVRCWFDNPVTVWSAARSPCRHTPPPRGLRKNLTCVGFVHMSSRKAED
jgi:hypothetical protein